MKKDVIGMVVVLIAGLTVLSMFPEVWITKVEPKPPYYEAIKPKGIGTIQAHLRRWGHPNNIYRRHRSETNVFIFVGLTNALPAAFPSGPPAYVYSESGAFLDWSPDLGDDPKVHDRWSNLWPNDKDEKITPAEIDRLFPR